MANTSGLHPYNNHVLVELGGYYKNIAVKEGKYDTRTNGIVIEGPIDRPALLGMRVYFDEFKEGSRIERDGKLYTFIKLEDIQGHEDDETQP